MILLKTLEDMSVELVFNSSGGFGLSAMTNDVFMEWLMMSGGSLRPLPRAQQCGPRGSAQAVSSSPTGLSGFRHEGRFPGEKDRVGGAGPTQACTLCVALWLVTAWSPPEPCWAAHLRSTGALFYFFSSVPSRAGLHFFQVRFFTMF